MRTIIKYTSSKLLMLTTGCAQLKPICDVTAISYSITAVGALAIMVLFPELSKAATAALSEAVSDEITLNIVLNDIKLLFASLIDKTIVLVALESSLTGWVLKFSPNIASSFGAALTTAFGLSAVIALIVAAF